MLDTPVLSSLISIPTPLAQNGAYSQHDSSHLTNLLIRVGVVNASQMLESLSESLQSQSIFDIASVLAYSTNDFGLAQALVAIFRLFSKTPQEFSFLVDLVPKSSSGYNQILYRLENISTQNHLDSFLSSLNYPSFDPWMILEDSSALFSWVSLDVRYKTLVDYLKTGDLQSFIVQVIRLNFYSDITLYVNLITEIQNSVSTLYYTCPLGSQYESYIDKDIPFR